MAKKKGMAVGEQAAELCLQIKYAVEGWWLYEALGTYVVVRNNQRRTRPFLSAYHAIWHAGFTSMIVSSHNLMDTRKSHFSLFAFADTLESEGTNSQLVSEIRNLLVQHDDFRKSLVRIRNKVFAHVESDMPTKQQFNEAKLRTAGLRIFIENLHSLFSPLSRHASVEVAAPDVKVRHQMMEMLHLAVRAKENACRA